MGFLGNETFGGFVESGFEVVLLRSSHFLFQGLKSQWIGRKRTGIHVGFLEGCFKMGGSGGTQVIPFLSHNLALLRYQRRLHLGGHGCDGDARGYTFIFISK